MSQTGKLSIMMEKNRINRDQETKHLWLKNN